jgi:hypothetical protein
VREAVNVEPPVERAAGIETVLVMAGIVVDIPAVALMVVDTET